MKNLILILSISFIMFDITYPVHSQENNFDIVFGGGWLYYPPGWLDTVKNRWGATAINFWVRWDDVEPQPGQFYWGNLYNSVNEALNHGLKVYVRIPAGSGYMPSWVNPGNTTLFNAQDFQIKHDGHLFELYGVKPLNFGSDNSRFYLFRYFDSVVNYLSTTFPGRIQYVLPSTSPDGEMEYTYAEMLGYSEPETHKFRQFLQQKYDNSITLLNTRWNSRFGSFNEIDPRGSDYDWDNQPPNNYPSGRCDWMQFRTALLKDYIDNCASITHSHNLKMGIELGSIYDERIDRRGWYDPVPLVENIDFFKIADIIEYKPNFEFAADYMRSVCNFWSYVQNKNIKFSTETNWPYIWGHPADLLCRDWSAQLIAYYTRGASCHFIFGWDLPVQELNNLERDYAVWRSTLNYYSGRPIQQITHTKAVHLSCEQGNFSGNNFTPIPDPYYDITYKYFDFLRSITPQENYIDNLDNYDGNCDIITGRMIEVLPTYVNRYSNFFLTKSSQYISKAAYLGLMKTTVTVPMGMLHGTMTMDRVNLPILKE